MSNFLNPNFHFGLALAHGAIISSSGLEFVGTSNAQVTLYLDPVIFPSGLTANQVYTIDVSITSFTQGTVNVIPGPSGSATFLLHPGDPTTGLSYTANGGETALTLRGTGASGGSIATIASADLY